MHKTSVFFNTVNDGLKFQDECGLNITQVNLMGEKKYITFENFFPGKLLLPQTVREHFRIIELQEEK